MKKKKIRIDVDQEFYMRSRALCIVAGISFNELIVNAMNIEINRRMENPNIAELMKTQLLVMKDDPTYY